MGQSVPAGARSFLVMHFQRSRIRNGESSFRNWNQFLALGRVPRRDHIVFICNDLRDIAYAPFKIGMQVALYLPNWRARQ